MGKVIIRNKENILPKEEKSHEPYHYKKYQVAEAEEGCECKVAVYEIFPGKANYPYHYHSNRTEVFYIIEGSGILITPEGEHPVSAGDIIICPPSAEGAHKLVNTSDTELLTYLDCDAVQYPDVVHYPHSHKIGVVERGVENTFYEVGSKVKYYKGE